MQDQSPGHRSLGRARDVKVFIPTLLGITECRLYAHQNCCANMYQSYQEVWSYNIFALLTTTSSLYRFWAFSAAALLAILLFYWLYGGVIAFLLVCFGVSGVLYQASRSPKKALNDDLICRREIVCCIIQSSRLTPVSLSLPPPSSTYPLTIFS